ncbi:MAG: MFS transporter [Actinomycetota bacterium]|nr:MFS transporter [Actinomycetota bacterium]
MTDAGRQVQRTYLLLTLLSTLAASFIWGINTLFLLDAGLSNTQAFTANAFFTVGQVLFEVPTGIVADTRGRRTSFLLGALTLLVSTLLYLLMWQLEASLLGWAIASVVIGLGFTFFSGAMEAWLVDALTAADFTGDLESVFARGQAVAGVAMLTGSVAGGLIAQTSNLGVPYLVRAGLLGVTVVVAWRMMHDLGFSPERRGGPVDEVRRIFRSTIDVGWCQRPIRLMMLAAPFTMGVGIYAFYAMQPHLLELYGDETAFGVAGLAAAAIAGAQIVGGLLVPRVRHFFTRRTDVVMWSGVAGAGALVGIGLTSSFVVALVLLIIWAMGSAFALPMRQAYVNGLIPAQQRATVLSFDALMGSAGGVVAQPALGRVADVYGYGASYVVSGGVIALATPFFWLARREKAASDPIRTAHPESELPLS